MLKFKVSALTVLLTLLSPPTQSAEDNSPGTQLRNLEGTNWQMVRMTVLGGYEYKPEEPGKYVLNFRSDNRLTGTSDCNEVGGLWFQESNALRFDPFYSSRKLCTPGSLHNNFSLYLRGAVSALMVGDNLLIETNTEGVELEFESR